MNQIIKVSLVCGLLINLTGCNRAITRFWNNDGYYPPPAENRAYDECSQTFDKINPPPKVSYPVSPEDWHSEESRRRTDEFYKYLNKCLKEKGF